MRVPILIRWVAVPALALAAGGGFVGAAASDPFPEVRPATRSEAVDLVGRLAEAPAPCLTPAIQRLKMSAGQDSAAGRALLLLDGKIRLVAEEKIIGPGGLSVRFTRESGSPDRVVAIDTGREGVPEIVGAAFDGVQRARHLLLTELGLEEPRPVELVLAGLSDPYSGYWAPPGSSHQRSRIVLESSPPGGPDETRRSAIHQYAHAVAAAAGDALPAEWGEAFATWAALAAEEQPDARTLESMSERIRRLDTGLTHAGLDLASGNAIWFSFLDQHYGRAGVRVTLEELSRGRPVAAALDRAVRRVSGDPLSTAFREFHLWSVLTGSRADGLHFSYAAELDPPSFAATAQGLPTLAVLADPPLAGLGATQILLRPEGDSGGLQIHFEGDFPALWEADLLLVDHEGSLRRVPLDLTADGRGDETVPLQGVAEAILLVRSLATELGALRHRYSYAAHLERAYPYELSLLDAARPGGPGSGVLIAWETLSERQLIGFNVLREHRDGGPSGTVNPVWVPALGSRARPTAYRFVDLSAEDGVGYRYRIQGITSNGLTVLSEPVTVPPADPRR